MNEQIARHIERVRQNRAALSGESGTRARVGADNPTGPAGAFVAGARAFDTVTGQHVEVVSVSSENVVVPAR